LFWFHSSVMFSYRATGTIFTGTQAQDIFADLWPLFCDLLFETNNFVLGAVPLSCLVSELQKPPSPGLELRTLSRSIYLPAFSSWCQGISMPSLVQIGVCLVELEVSIHTRNFNYAFIR
jgi:hypothetical protein